MTQADASDKIFVAIERINGDLVPLEMHATSTLKELKRRIEEATGVAPLRQQLALGSEVLDHASSCKALSDLEIKDDTKLFLVEGTALQDQLREEAMRIINEATQDTRFCQAAWQGEAEALLDYVQAGADVNAMNRAGRSALNVAAYCGVRADPSGSAC
eukprot:TRINITY_DN106747_c0_g1_i1.p1 TRINITY_DN106747_c0_g1~~TRINITY_DN106747_c0_g1_i1.p1  ORF type:complete len:159 (-),score=36.19 TRINITY_DN106747_c0_g1_i1:285-761(-)